MKKMSGAQASFRTSLLWTSITLVALSQWVFQGMDVEQRGKIIWLTILGAILFLIPLIPLIRDRNNPTGLEKAMERVADWFHLSGWQIALLFTSPFLSYIAFIAAGEGQRMWDPVEAILTWILAIGAAILGGCRKLIQKLQLQALPLILPLALTIIAFILRALEADHVPIVLSGDEGSAGIAALSFIKGQMNNPFISGWYSFPSLYFFIPALSIRMFGETTLALRLPSALAGALTVTATYFTARIIFDRRTALVSGIFLAAYSYHINFSRIGLNNIWDGLWYTLAIGAIWYGWEHEEINAFTIAGLCLGLAQYFYPSGRALIMPIVLWFLIMALFNREKFKRILPYIVTMFIVGIVVLLPLGIFYIHHPDEFMAPISRVTVFGPILDSLIKSSNQPAWWILLKQIGEGLGAFTYLPLNAWYTPGVPLLLPLPASLFLLGILILLARKRTEKFTLLALWIFTFGLIGGLSESTPAAQRYIAAAPVCALLIGFGLSDIMGLLERLWPKYDRILYATTVAIAIIMAVNELYFYFLVYTPKTVSTWSHSAGVIAQSLANELKGRPSNLEVVFFGQPIMGYYSIPSLQYLVPDIQGVDATIPWNRQNIPNLQNQHNLLFVFLPGNESAIQPVEADYPGGQLNQEMATDGTPLYWYYNYQTP